MNNPNPVIPLFDLNYGSEEEEATLRVLRSKWLTMGPETEALEYEFAEYLKACPGSKQLHHGFTFGQSGRWCKTGNRSNLSFTYFCRHI